MFVSKVDKILEMLEKIKTDVDRLLFVLKFKKSSIIAKYIGTLFFIIKTKIRLFMSDFIFSTISQISETKFYIFWT